MHRRTEEFVERATERHGLDLDVREFPGGTKTAAAAADAVGCDVGQIASSLVFDVDGDLAVVVTSGANRASESKVAAAFDADAAAVSMADPEAVRETVGWAIGGVPPFCHDADLPTLVDETLFEYDAVWAAAGTPQSMFTLAPETLRECADGTRADVAEE